MARAITLLEGDTGQKIASTEILAGGVVGSTFVPLKWRAFASGVTLNAGVPSVTLNTPDIVPVAGAGGLLLQLCVGVAVTAAAPGNFVMNVTLGWGAGTSAVGVILPVDNPVAMPANVTAMQLVIPFQLTAPAADAPLSLTFAAVLAGADAIDVPASVNNFSVEQKVGVISFASWT